MVEMQNRKWKVDSLLFASDNIFMFTHSKWKSTQEGMEKANMGPSFSIVHIYRWLMITTLLYFMWEPCGETTIHW